MLTFPRIAPAAFSMAAVMAWGTSDFLGGYLTRRANPFLFTAIFNWGGLALMVSLAKATHAPSLSPRSVIWILAGGVSGSAGLAIFFRALSKGRMGLVAPVASVLGAAIPALVSIFTEGLPGRVSIFGFFLGATGLFFITRSEDGNAPENIGLAVAAGIGFAGFFLCIRQAGNGSPFWFATFMRIGGLAVTSLIVVLRRTFRMITASGVCGAVLAGCIDSFGTIFFVGACQRGRLDEVVVISSLYPAVTVLLARIVLKERFTRWRLVGLLAALAAVPVIAAG